MLERKKSRVMKKQDKIEVINKGIVDVEICRCYFSYYDSYVYYYPNAMNDKFILGQQEDDFILDGYWIHKISDLKKVEIKNDKCNEINKLNGLTKNVVMPIIDITSWETIFISLKEINRFVIVEDVTNDEFLIGLIDKVYKKKIRFKAFDADGQWQEGTWDIPYSSITNIAWDTRYTKNWEMYFEKYGKLGE
jgi:hypothetical protein